MISERKFSKKGAKTLKSVRESDYCCSQKLSDQQEQSSFQIKPRKLQKQKPIKDTCKSKKIQNDSLYIQEQNQNVAWNSQQTKKIFSFYQELGTQWSVIQKKLPGRTQNTIKNKFYGTLRKLLRSIFRQVGIVPGNKIRNLSANRLTDIYDGRKQFKEFKGMIKTLLERMDYQISRKTIIQFVDGKTAKITQFFYVIFPKNTIAQAQARAEMEPLPEIQHAPVRIHEIEFTHPIQSAWPFNLHNCIYNYQYGVNPNSLQYNPDLLQYNPNPLQYNPYIFQRSSYGFE